MEDILIAGYSLKDLQKRQKEIQKYANIIVSNNLQSVYSIVNQIKQIYENTDNFDSVDKNEIKQLSDNAICFLKQIQEISKATNIEYHLAYWNEYGDNEDVLSVKIENLDWYEHDETCDRLLHILSDMEYQSKQWDMGFK